MRKLTFIATLTVLMLSCSRRERQTEELTLKSPQEELELQVLLTGDGQPAFVLRHKQTVLLDTSTLGMAFADGRRLQGSYTIAGSATDSWDRTWEQPWGEQRVMQDKGRELLVSFEQAENPGQDYAVRFRLYNDGFAFRYEFSEGAEQVTISEELTRFQLNGDHLCWWAPGDWDIYEHLYTTSRFSAIDATAKRNHPALAQTYIPENAVNTPLTMRTDQGLYLVFHEAALTDFTDMTLRVDTAELALEAALVGRPDGLKADMPGTWHTPWRTVQVGEKAGALIESTMLLNLNEPNRVGDVSWFRPMTYAGIWWDMHLGRRDWHLEGGNHGATTAYARELIDFAAANNIGGVLVEGWNTGWASWFGDGRPAEGPFDFITPYPDYDLAEVAAYARDKGVSLIMHHETSAMPLVYERYLDTAFALMRHHELRAVKTGYVSKIIPEGEYHHGQFMVKHYRKVVETAARYGIAVNAHEPIKDTGTRRTWPNEISREGLRGQEFNAWSPDGGNPPEHASIVAYTRMLAGPIDYTPGIFNIKLKPHRPDNQVNTTLAHQLALYVVFYSPIQMVPDLIEHYEGHPAMDFIRELAVDWEQTQGLDGEPGEFAVVARQERGSQRWFLGAVSDEQARTLTISLDFLEPGLRYEATLFTDGEGAHWDLNPTALNIGRREVGAGEQLTLELVPGGGAAIRFSPLDN